MSLLILNFIRQHWLMVAEVILLSTIGIQHLEISHLSHTVLECRAQNTALVDANAKLSAAVESQNMAVTKLQAESEEKTASATRSLTAAKADADKYDVQATYLKSLSMSGNDCADMIRMLNDYVKHGG